MSGKGRKQTVKLIGGYESPTWMYDCKDAGGRTTQEIKSRW